MKNDNDIVVYLIARNEIRMYLCNFMVILLLVSNTRVFEKIPITFFRFAVSDRLPLLRSIFGN